MRHLIHIKLVLLVATIVMQIGCTPRVNVVSNPGPHSKGFRYYRPKPYLLITPIGATVAVKTAENTTTTSTQSDEYVNIELEYLPDFSEEYAIDVKTGLGTAEVSFKLEDGWKLTEMNQKLDSQFDENVSAIADLVRAGGEVIRPTGEGDGGLRAANETKRWAVRATNVPIGYYESVISRDPGCKKRLYGWRYVGFAPFNGCPTDVMGLDLAACDDPNGPIYGLVFENGAMTFKRLNAIKPDLERTLVEHGTVVFSRTPPVSEPATVDEQNEKKIQDAIVNDPNMLPVNPDKKPENIIVVVAGDKITVTIRTSEMDADLQNTALARAFDLAVKTAKANGISDPKVEVGIDASGAESLPEPTETALRRRF